MRLALFIICLMIWPAALMAGPSVLSNGDFETAAVDAPKDWTLKSGASWEKDGENHFLRLKVQKPEEQVMVYRRVDLKPDVKALELKYRARWENVVRGKQSWFDGRIMMNFKDASGD